MDKLPTELILDILLKLDARDITSMCKYSKRITKICLDNSKEISNHILKTYKKRYPQLKNKHINKLLSLDEEREKFVLKMMSKDPSLKFDYVFHNLEVFYKNYNFDPNSWVNRDSDSESESDLDLDSDS